MAFILTLKTTKRAALRIARNTQLLAGGIRVKRLARPEGKNTHGVWAFVKKTAKRRKAK